MRLLVAVAMLVLSAGCLESRPAAVQDEAAAQPAQQVQTMQVGGRYTALKPLGEPLQEQGGRNPIDVAGWKLVTVSLDANIEVDVALLPPGCASSKDPCALRFAPDDDVTQASWTLDGMEPGAWTVVVEAAPADYSYVDGTYSVAFEYLLA